MREYRKDGMELNDTRYGKPCNKCGHELWISLREKTTTGLKVGTVYCPRDPSLRKVPVHMKKFVDQSKAKHEHRERSRPKRPPEYEPTRVDHFRYPHYERPL